MSLEVECRAVKKNFGEVVAKQSMENIRSLFERYKQKLESTVFEYLYHSCSEALVKQPEIKKLRAIVMRIEVATKHFWIDFNSRYT